MCTRYAAKTLRPAGLEIRDRGKYAYMAWNELHVKDILTFWGAWQLGCIVADSGMQQNKSTYQRVINDAIEGDNLARTQMSLLYQNGTTG